MRSRNAAARAIIQCGQRASAEITIAIISPWVLVRFDGPGYQLVLPPPLADKVPRRDRQQARDVGDKPICSAIGPIFAATSWGSWSVWAWQARRPVRLQGGVSLGGIGATPRQRAARQQAVGLAG